MESSNYIESVVPSQHVTSKLKAIMLGSAYTWDN